ncbi:MAG: hypothetical protein HKO81_00930 [Flavobacteriaceae bacterium]|nr:hypothetical protein [Bacteroidia bacterium]NNL15188.1 hypothetical protein [Flavobacteriaceae bacterium]
MNLNNLNVPHNYKNIAEQYGTPLYIYDTERIKDNLSAILKFLTYQNSKVFFAVMCNNQPEILKTIKNLGIGVQVNSENELDLVKEAGFNISDISFSSTGISMELMKKLSKENIEINFDSVEEVEKYCALNKNKTFGIRVRIPKRIKIISDEATNIYSHSNVGIEEKDFSKITDIAEKTGNKTIGVHGYFASNVFDEKPFIEFGNFLFKIANNFPDLEYVNFGSGFGVRCKEKDKDFNFKKVLKHYSSLCNKLSRSFQRAIILKIEPGRTLLADAGILLVKVTNIKKLSPKKSEISVNAGFAEFARPRVYNSYHIIDNLEKSGKPKKVYDIRGNTVLQNDFLGRDRKLEEVKEGEFLIVKNVGAYGIVMASGFPGKKLPNQILISKSKIEKSEIEYNF